MRSFYCDMFGRYVNINCAGHMYVGEIIINPETTGMLDNRQSDECSGKAGKNAGIAKGTGIVWARNMTI